MGKRFRITMLPALHGDCLWIEYGEDGDTHHVLVDGGPVGAFPALRAQVEAIPQERREVELVVVTHIDADHIDGIVKLLRHPEVGLKYREMWFNGWPQLSRPLSGASAAPGGTLERGVGTAAYLDFLTMRGGSGCNDRFVGSAALVPDDGPLPRARLPGGLELTLLSPTVEKLKALRATWLKAFSALGGSPGDEAFIGARLDKDIRFRGDDTALPALPTGLDEAADAATALDAAVANGSSLAFVAEYEGRRCAFLGDAHAPVIQQALGRLSRERGEEPLRLDAVKVSHHGSDGNTTTLLLQKIACRNYLVSTNGSVFKHPDEAAIARIVKHAAPARLFFNYRSDFNRGWDDADRKRQWNYEAVYPPEGRSGIELDLLALNGSA
jgi:hypothetical protein